MQHQYPPPQQVPQQYDQQSSQPASNPIVDPSSMKYKLRNQLIPGYSFLPNIKCCIIFSLCIGSLLLVLGIVVMIISSTVIEVDKRYDDICGINQQDCTVKVDVTEAMSKPVYLYLGVQNFYQNHRLYVKSYSADQLWGENIDADTAKSKCSPITLNSDLGTAPTSWFSSSNYLTLKDVANPCGMIANSWIQDVFALKDSSGNTIAISVEDIAWSIDKERKFKRNDDFKTVQYIDVEDERFINWMSFSTLYNWRKLWGVVDQDLPVGTYTFTIWNKYDVLSFSGEKHVILSNVTALGGTSKLLAVLLLIMGCANIFLAVVLAGFNWYKKLANHTSTLDFNWD